MKIEIKELSVVCDNHVTNRIGVLYLLCLCNTYDFYRKNAFKMRKKNIVNGQALMKVLLIKNGHYITKRFVFFEFIYLFILFLYFHVCFQLVAFVREHIWHKALLMGYSVRLELIRACSLNDFQLVMAFITN